jgi:hypothetical protein
MKTNDILEKKSYPLNDEILEGLKVSLNTFKNSNNKAGLKRAEDFLKNRVISFKEMERLKNFFTTYDGSDEQEYRLSGGDLMKDFVINGVAQLRKAIDNVKRTRMKAGEENQYKKTHTKDRDNANPTNVNKANVQTSSDEIMDNRTTYSESYENEIDKMRYLIEYMDNNKTKI